MVRLDIHRRKMKESESITVTSQFQQLKTNKNKEFHHSSKTDNPVYPIY